MVVVEYFSVHKLEKKVHVCVCEYVSPAPVVLCSRDLGFQCVAHLQRDSEERVNSVVWSVTITENINTKLMYYGGEVVPSSLV